MNIQDMINSIQQDRSLKPGEKIIVCLNRDHPSMLECAYQLDAGGVLHDAFCVTSSDGDKADEAAVRLSKEGEDLVAFHETRPSSKDHRPNGIRVHNEDLDFPCVVFCNSGKEPLTVDGEWLEPGSCTAIQERDLSDPEVQKALEELMRSPEVMEEVNEVRRQMKEKEQQGK